MPRLPRALSRLGPTRALGPLAILAAGPALGDIVVLDGTLEALPPGVVLEGATPVRLGDGDLLLVIGGDGQLGIVSGPCDGALEGCPLTPAGPGDVATKNGALCLPDRDGRHSFGTAAAAPES